VTFFPSNFPRFHPLPARDPQAIRKDLVLKLGFCDFLHLNCSFHYTHLHPPSLAASSNSSTSLFFYPPLLNVFRTVYALIFFFLLPFPLILADDPSPRWGMNSGRQPVFSPRWFFSSHPVGSISSYFPSLPAIIEWILALAYLQSLNANFAHFLLCLLTGSARNGPPHPLFFSFFSSAVSRIPLSLLCVLRRQSHPNLSAPIDHRLYVDPSFFS